jgi:hypothetical protein
MSNFQGPLTLGVSDSSVESLVKSFKTFKLTYHEDFMLKLTFT